MNKKLPTISIKGKEYVMVKDRINAFNEEYPEGKIETRIIKDETDVVVQATVTPDCENPNRYFTAHSQSTKGQGQMGGVALENAETSAVGRALAFMGIGVIQSIASADEINKAGYGQGNAKPYVKKVYTGPVANSLPPKKILPKAEDVALGQAVDELPFGEEPMPEDFLK